MAATCSITVSSLNDEKTMVVCVTKLAFTFSSSVSRGRRVRGNITGDIEDSVGDVVDVDADGNDVGCDDVDVDVVEGDNEAPGRDDAGDIIDDVVGNVRYVEFTGGRWGNNNNNLSVQAT